MNSKIYTAPPNVEKVALLGRTLPSLLDEACERYRNTNTFYHRTDKDWIPLSNQEFRQTAEQLALGLLESGLQKGERVCLFMQNDLNFAFVDMGCLLAKLIDVPLYLTETEDNIVFIIQQIEARALFVSNLKLLHKIAPLLSNLPPMMIVVAEVDSDFQQSLPALPTDTQVLSLAEICAKGKAHLSSESQQQLRNDINPKDLATIIYTSGTTGQPKGVMLTHENISAAVIAGFKTVSEIKPGSQEVILFFLPLMHILGRALLYGHIYYGHRIYFTTPERLVEHLKEIRPTLLFTVPRLLEVIYARILKKANQLKGITKVLFMWALNLAKRYEIGHQLGFFYALQLKIARRIIFSKWQAAFGGRLKYLMSGGAALRTDIANIFTAAGLTTLEGYGLTETSSAICYNRYPFHQAGTVGVPAIGVEIALAEDGEILVRAPCVMIGYYKNPEATQEALDGEGWFHTGDIGEFTADGFLKIVDRKKNLFKLSNGEYVVPQPVENQLQASPLIDYAIVVGAERKFCTLLIFPNQDSLQEQAQAMDLKMTNDEIIKHPKIIALYQTLINEANQGLSSWAVIKRFKLINETLTIENGLLTPTLKVKRRKVNEVFAAKIDSLYETV